MPAGGGEGISCHTLREAATAYLRFCQLREQPRATTHPPGVCVQVAWCRRGDDRDVSRSRNETGVDRRGRRSASRLLRRSAHAWGARPALILASTTRERPSGPQFRGGDDHRKYPEQALAPRRAKAAAPDCRQRSWGVRRRSDTEGAPHLPHRSPPWRHDVRREAHMNHSASLPRCDAGGDPPRQKGERSLGVVARRRWHLMGAGFRGRNTSERSVILPSLTRRAAIPAFASTV